MIWVILHLTVPLNMPIAVNELITKYKQKVADKKLKLQSVSALHGFRVGSNLK